jgi:hypothetical protein
LGQTLPHGRGSDWGVHVGANEARLVTLAGYLTQYIVPID